MKEDTKLVHLGRGPSSFEGTVNLPVYRASTILSADMDSYIHRFDDEKNLTDITYGARGTQNSRALGEAIADLEGGHGTIVTTSGLSAISVALGALVSAGDHILISDSVYGPTRTFCNQVLSRYGVTFSFAARWLIFQSRTTTNYPITGTGRPNRINSQHYLLEDLKNSSVAALASAITGSI